MDSPIIILKNVYSQTKESVHRFQVGFLKGYNCAKLTTLVYFWRGPTEGINFVFIEPSKMRSSVSGSHE